MIQDGNMKDMNELKNKVAKIKWWHRIDWVTGQKASALRSPG